MKVSKKNNFIFKEENTLDERIRIVKDLKKKYIGKIPIICEKSSNCKFELEIKSHFMFPNDLYFNEFIYIIRQKLKLKSSVAIFLIIDDKYSIMGNDPISIIYEKYKDKDGILYIHYSDQEIYG